MVEGVRRLRAFLIRRLLTDDMTMGEIFPSWGQELAYALKQYEKRGQ